ncbi:GyrI-like domain-containing protein [Nocardia wallacei]|uniref:GyrI-like small molecule binding domain-containing protein n=2 Tax=Nocardia wallacei TaxID=480035 RepID=A0A7G1L185_9NOCA|nr:GyrI-like domain-containing protein [Nocardia wallacei]BCK59124.1 hypothetical protein NWFMUON74_68960 [Nocardia wallacei]
MSDSTLRLEPLPELHVAHVHGEVNHISEIGAMVEALFGNLIDRLDVAGVSPVGRNVRIYNGRSDESKIDVSVGVLLESGAAPIAGLETVELVAEARGATMRYHRLPVDIADPWLTVDAFLEERGLESYGPYREIHYENGPGNRRIVELQCPVRDIGGACQ